MSEKVLRRTEITCLELDFLVLRLTVEEELAVASGVTVTGVVVAASVDAAIEKEVRRARSH